MSERLGSSLKLFDASCAVGYSRLHRPGAPTTAGELVQAMQRYGIDRALVYHTEAVWHNPHLGNQRLLSEIAEYPALEPCWVVMPHHSREVPHPEEVVAEMLVAGVRAARLFPGDHRFSLRLWNLRDLLENLAAFRIPLWVDFGHQSWSEDKVDWDGLHEVCAAFAALPVILVRASIGDNRRLLALMERLPNLYVETSYYTVHRGIEFICDCLGPERVLFGTGMPLRAPGPAITALTYSLLDDAACALVAGGNLRRLLGRVSLPS
jgi:predicted TIM-barrel fold metal-dependent hydrolase